MKRKFILTLCALLGVMFTLAGCADRKDDTAGNRTSASTSDRIVEMSDNGDYDAGKDGKVNDEDKDGKDRPSDITDDKPPVTTEGTSDGAQSSDITNDGTAPGTTKRDAKITSDEAAFASSYITAAALSERAIGWGLGKDRDDKNRPIDAVKAEEKYAASGGKFLASDGKICLTFDEGYENGYTGRILDTLKEKGVKAVFFVTYDYVKSAPELVQRMIDEGHTVGNHTWSHPSLPGCTQKEVWAEVTKLHDYVKDNFGYEMTLFRFPKGEFSERTLNDVHELGYTTLFWSFAYADWDTSKHTDPAEALAKFEDSTHSGIYLLHAVSETNAQILGELIDYWTEKGYSVGAEV